jgi:hypothetical protein
MKNRGADILLATLSASVGGLLGCAAGPEVVYERLLQVDSTRICYSFVEAITVAPPTQIVKNIEQEVLLEESDPVFDVGWTISYYDVLRFEGLPGKRYCLRVQSLCHCFAFTKTLVLPYVYVVSAIGDSLGEGPGELHAMEPTMTLPIHLNGSFDFSVGETGSCYVLILADNRGPGRPSASWQSRFLGADGIDYELQGDVVASPVGEVRVTIEDVK